MGRNLIVGVDGMIGSALYAEAKRQELDVVGTTRRVSGLDRIGWRVNGLAYLDLVRKTFAPPKADVAFICAGIVGYKHCEGNAESWRVNVDGTIALIDTLLEQGSFVVFMSSDAVEHMPSTAYGLQKAAVEAFLRTRARRESAYVRAGRVDGDCLAPLCNLLLLVGSEKLSGPHHFYPPGHGLGR